MGGFISAGYGGSNANAGAGGLGQFGGPSMASWSQANSQMGQAGMLNRGNNAMTGRQYMGQLHPGTGAGSGYGFSSYGGSGGGGFGNNQQMLDLANQAHNDFNDAQNTNIGRWQQGNQYLQNAQQGYFNDPTHQAANGLVNNLLANPDVLSQRVQGEMQNGQANMINAQVGAQARQQAGILAGNGQTDAGSLAAMNNNLSRQGIGQLGAAQQNLDIQAAQMNRQSEESAAGLGNAQAQQNYGVNQNMANSYLQNMYLQKPFDYSPYLAAMHGGFNGGGSGQQGYQGAPQFNGGGQQPPINFRSPTSGGFQSTNGNGVGFGSFQGGNMPGMTIANGGGANFGSLGNVQSPNFNQPNGPGAFFMPSANGGSSNSNFSWMPQ